MSEKVKFWLLLFLLIASISLVWYVNSSYSRVLLGPING
jgi:hypothetical protein